MTARNDRQLVAKYVNKSFSDSPLPGVQIAMTFLIMLMAMPPSKYPVAWFLAIGKASVCGAMSYVFAGTCVWWVVTHYLRKWQQYIPLATTSKLLEEWQHLESGKARTKLVHEWNEWTLWITTGRIFLSVRFFAGFMGVSLLYDLYFIFRLKNPDAVAGSLVFGSLAGYVVCRLVVAHRWRKTFGASDSWLKETPDS